MIEINPLPSSSNDYLVANCDPNLTYQFSLSNDDMVSYYKEIFRNRTNKNKPYIDRFNSIEELEEVTMKFAKKLAAGPLISYKNIKKQIYNANYSDYKKWLAETEIPTQRECAASMDFQEGCKAFMEKRKAIFEGK